MEITQMLLTPNEYSRPQIPLKTVTKIAVHYVGNAGSSAVANRNYFNNLAKTHERYVSSHYIVGLEGEIIQCIPESEMSYCTNSANRYSISIENCHPAADGKFNEKTVHSLKELCANICKRYNLNPLTDILRHYDVTGKHCPLYWVKHPEDFERFKKDVRAFMDESETPKTVSISIGDMTIKANAETINGKLYISVETLEKAGLNVHIFSKE